MKIGAHWNPFGQTSEQPGAAPSAETMPAGSVPKSPGAHWSVEESTTVADGVGGGEWLATTAVDVTEMPGAMARAVESSEVETRATDVVSKPGA